MGRAVALSQSKYDGIVFEMEHNPWDAATLRDSLQYMLNRGQILKAGSPALNVVHPGAATYLDRNAKARGSAPDAGALER